MEDDKAKEKAVKFLQSKSLRIDYKPMGTRRRHDHALTCTDLTPLDASEMYAYEFVLESERNGKGHSKYFPLEMVDVNSWPFVNCGARVAPYSLSGPSESPGFLKFNELFAKTKGCWQAKHKR
ncbi:hypothetical protein AAVH_09157 [Aphelenchoides avenae]|nr:hypothetical protein AAVH_09157 [Aphelenchus avenae]